MRSGRGCRGRSASSWSGCGRSIGGRLVGGAHIVAPGAAFTAANDLGYLTSAAFSPALGHDVALGFLLDGRAREGARLRAVCALRGIDTPVEVVAPVFVDPEGRRARG